MLQCNSAIADEEKMLDAQEILESGFQLFHLRAVVGKLVGRPDAFEIPNVFFEGRQVGFGDVDNLFNFEYLNSYLAKENLHT